jgi:hypothetical protein
MRFEQELAEAKRRLAEQIYAQVHGHAPPKLMDNGRVCDLLVDEDGFVFLEAELCEPYAPATWARAGLAVSP